jgi:cephalosporin hydroxylase
MSSAGTSSAQSAARANDVDLNCSNLYSPTMSLRDEAVDQMCSKMGPVMFHSTWLGAQAVKNPCDAWVYQEIVYANRPDWIIETGTHRGGGAVFLASICDLVGNGHVISIDMGNPPPAQHPRVTWLTGTGVSQAAEVARRVSGTVMVILDSDHSTENVAAELKVFAPMVTRGQYLIVEDTWWNPDVGGPWPAVREFVESHPEFQIDKSCERYLWTNNPNGFLKLV